MRLFELRTTDQDMSILHDFYESVYLKEFNDPNEIVSISDIKAYLKLKEDGWYGSNNYHVLIAQDEEAVLGGAIFDYFAIPNSGVIEFLAVRKDTQGKGIGKYILHNAENILRKDAKDLCSRDLDAIFCEIEDPNVYVGPSSIDPFVRKSIWESYGYRKIHFNYIQPALSISQQPVEHLLLLVKQFQKRKEISSDLVKQFIHEYMRLAMGIELPEHTQEFKRMKKNVDFPFLKTD